MKHPMIQLLTRNDLSKALCMSKRSTYRIDDLPAAVSFGKGEKSKKYWKASDIDAWLDSKKEAN